MAKVKIQGHASGTGVITVTAPNTSTDRTITLPDSTGTILDENSSLPAANLTGTVADARLSTTGVTAGVLKENLLTNSGFDVWSNSTLENVGSTLVTNGTFASNANSWSQNVGGVLSWASAYAITTNVAGGYDYMYQNITGLTIGKLYKLTWKQYAHSSTPHAGVHVYESDGSTETIPSVYNQTQASWDEYSLIFECSDTTQRIAFRVSSSTTGKAVRWDDITFYEVTPGCVASDYVAFDGWHKGTNTDIWRQHNDATHTKEGSFYSLKFSAGSTGQFVNWKTFGASGASVSEDTIHGERLTGRTVTVGCWVKSDGTNEAGIYYRDYLSSSWAYRCYDSTTSSSWTWIEGTYTWDTSTSPHFSPFLFYVASGGTAYFSQPMLVYGNSIGEGNYTRPQGEIVYLENSVQVEPADAPSSSTTSMNLESLSSGVIPKGAKAITGYMNARNSAAEKWLQIMDEASGNGVIMYSQVANLRVAESFTIPCDTNGDVLLHAEDGNWSGLDLYVNAVELR